MKNSVKVYIADQTTKFDDSRIGFHCGDCGEFYTLGDYTIEVRSDKGETFILCSKSGSQTCCGESRPTPVVCMGVEEAESAMQSIQKSDYFFVRKNTLFPAHFNHKVFFQVH